MIAFPHAKINLGLSIVSKRPDGFHNLETVFYPLASRDILEIVTANLNGFSPSGLLIPGKADENLVLRSYDLLKRHYPVVGPLHIYLHKAIPLGAGLGGGSSDAAEMIKLISRFFKLDIPDEKLKQLALELGSDCPFFLESGPCFASGRGELLEPVALDLSRYSFLLIHPEIQIRTAWAFSKIVPAAAKYNLKEMILTPIRQWVHTVHNDFEKPVFKEYPNLGKIKAMLYDADAIYSAMSGSGSTIFGIFEKGALPEISVENASQTFIG